MKLFILIFLFAFLALFGVVFHGLQKVIAATNPNISVGSISGAKGSTVDLPISFTPGTTGVSALQFDLTLPSSLTYVSVTTGSAATQAGKSVEANATTSTQVRVLVYGLNQNIINSGQIASVKLSISPSAPSGSLSVVIGGVVASDPNALAVTTTGTGGSVVVSQTATPTPVPTPTPITQPGSRPRPSQYSLKEGMTVAAYGSNDPDVYIINDSGFKRLFLNPIIFSFYGHLGGFKYVVKISSTTRDVFETSGIFRNCETSDPRVYAVEVTGEDTGTLHHINMTGGQAVSQDPEFFKKVFCINNNEFNWYTKNNKVFGTPYTALNQISVYRR